MTQTEKIISAYQDQYMLAQFYDKIIKNHKDELDEERLVYYYDKSEKHWHATRILVGLLSADLMRKHIWAAKKWANQVADDMYNSWLKKREA